MGTPRYCTFFPIMKYKFIVLPILAILGVFIYGRNGGSFAFLGIGNRHLPDIIVLGAQKAGTIQLLRMINLHSQIVVTKKVIDEFGSHEISFLDENWEKGLSWYLSKMPIAEPDQLTVDFTPKYLFSEEAPERAHQVLPQAKLLLVVRDPIDRLVSDFHHLNASSQIESLEEFANSNQEVMKFGYYADHIKNWLRFYPKEQLYIVNGNDLMTEPALELAKIETFLGVEHEIVDNDFVFNNNKHFYCQIAKHKNKEECQHSSAQQKNPHKNAALHPHLKEKLIEHYKPKVEELFEIAGTRFEWKHFKET